MCRVFLFALLVISSSVRASDVGDLVGEEAMLAEPRVSTGHAGGSLVWSTRLSFAGADYVAPHFARLALPPGAVVVVRSEDGSRRFTYDAREKTPESGRWGAPVPGGQAIVELFSKHAIRGGAVVIDRFARGFRAEEIVASRRAQPLSLCGADDSLWAKCYEASDPEAYGKARAVARLLVDGTRACTGFLVGSEGHVLTNAHCIATESDATNTTFEFMAEGTSCASDCASWGACPGAIVAAGATLVKASASYDYALVKLPVNPTASYGFLKLRRGAATVGERVTVPQHPAGWGKKIAVKTGAGEATIVSVDADPCTRSEADLAYDADTQGGSSGSPVIATSDGLVVGLHHCGSCPNRAVPTSSVVRDLGVALPKDAAAGEGTSGCELPPLVSDGGFEEAADVSWTATPLVLSDDPREPAHSGARKAWLCGYYDAHVDTLSKRLSIPACAASATLAFWIHVDTAETTTREFDTLTVVVRDEAGADLATLGTFSNLDAAPGYVLRAFSLDAYRGRRIEIVFIGSEDATLQTSFVIDDVAVGSR